MTRPLIDGQRPERAEPMPMFVLRNVEPAPPWIVGLETIEIDLAFWLSESEWPDTIKMDIADLAG